MNRSLIIVQTLCIAASTATLQASVFGTDVPGDGVSSCLIEIPSCSSTFIGTASSAPPGLLSGTLHVGGSTLALQVGAVPEFIVFGGGTDASGDIGPLGFNPQYTSIGGNNVGMPISGQLLTVNITNTSAFPLTAVSFYLEVPQTVITSGFTPQPDGLTFGMFCPLLVTTCSTSQLTLMATPTGPAGSTLNPADLSSATDTFGDLLRFSNLNIATGGTGAFSFWITDYKGTRPPNTNGRTASGLFNLEVVPLATPEPIPSGLAGLGFILLLAFKKRLQHRFSGGRRSATQL